MAEQEPAGPRVSTERVRSAMGVCRRADAHWDERYVVFEDLRDDLLDARAKLAEAGRERDALAVQVAALRAFMDGHGHCNNDADAGDWFCEKCGAEAPHHVAGCAYIALMHDTTAAAERHDAAVRAPLEAALVKADALADGVIMGHGEAIGPPPCPACVERAKAYREARAATEAK